MFILNCYVFMLQDKMKQRYLYKAIMNLLHIFQNWQTIKVRIQKQRKKVSTKHETFIELFIRLC